MATRIINCRVRLADELSMKKAAEDINGLLLGGYFLHTRFLKEPSSADDDHSEASEGSPLLTSNCHEGMTPYIDVTFEPAEEEDARVHPSEDCLRDAFSCLGQVLECDVSHHFAFFNAERKDTPFYREPSDTTGKPSVISRFVRKEGTMCTCLKSGANLSCLGQVLGWHLSQHSYGLKVERKNMPFDWHMSQWAGLSSPVARKLGEESTEPDSSFAVESAGGDDPVSPSEYHVVRKSHPIPPYCFPPYCIPQSAPYPPIESYLETPKGPPQSNRELAPQDGHRRTEEVQSSSQLSLLHAQQVEFGSAGCNHRKRIGFSKFGCFGGKRQKQSES